MRRAQWSTFDPSWDAARLPWQIRLKQTTLWRHNAVDGEINSFTRLLVRITTASSASTSRQKMYTLSIISVRKLPSVCARNYSKPPLITSESCRRYNASSAKTSSYLINLSPDSCESLSSLLVVWHGGWAEGLNGDSRGPTLLPLVHTPTRGRTKETVPPWWKPVTGGISISRR